MDRSKRPATFAVATVLAFVWTALLFVLGWAGGPWFIQRTLVHAKETIPTLSEVSVGSPSKLFLIPVELALHSRCRCLSRGFAFSCTFFHRSAFPPGAI